MTPQGHDRTALGLLVLSTLVFTAYYFGLRGGQPSFWNDTYEYAQAARNVAEGKGLTSDAATVLEIGLFGRAGRPLPYFLHDPANSLLMAGAFLLLGARETAVGLAAGACYILLAPLTYVLGKGLFGHETARVAGLVVASNAQLIVYAGAGYSETPIAFFLTVLLLVLLQERAGARVLAGVVFGVLVLLRANALPFLPFLLIFVAARVPLGARGWARVRGMLAPVLLFLLGALFVIVPSVARYRYWSGQAGFISASSLVHHTAAVPGKATERFSRPPERIDALAYIYHHPRELVGKMAWQGTREVRSLLRGGQLPRGDFLSATLVFLFLFSILVPRRLETPLRRHVRWLVAALCLTALVVGAAFHLRWRHLYAFLPVAILFGGDELARLLRGRRIGRGAALGVLLVLIGCFGAGPLLDSVGEAGERTDARDAFYRELGTFLGEHTAPNALVLLDVDGDRFNPLGNALAWHARRTLLQYSPYTLASPVLRGSRPVYALLVHPVGEGPEADEAGSEDGVGGGLSEDPGFRPVATYTHGQGTAILYR